MNKLLKFIVIMAISSMSFSCDDMMDVHQQYLNGGEKIYAPKIDSLVFHNGKNRAQVWFWLLESPNVRSVDIFWNNYADSLIVPVTPSANLDSAMVYVPLKEERAYTLYIRTTDIFGNHSLSEMGSVTSYDSIYESTLTNRVVKSAETSGSTATVQWYGAGDDYVYSEVRYLDVNNDTLIVRALPNETSTLCPDAKTGSTYEHRSLYVPVNSIDTFYLEWTPITPIVIKVNKIGWTIEVSDAHTEGGGKDKVIDGDYATAGYWHSMYSPNAACPHWAVIDMKEPIEVIRVATLRRSGGDTKTLQYFIGDDPDPDADTWVKIAEGAYASKTANHTLTLDVAEPVTGRYLKLVLPDSFRDPFIQIHEIDVYKF